VSLSNILLIPGVGGDLQELRGLLFGNGQAGWMGFPSLDNTAIAANTLGSGIETFRDLYRGNNGTQATADQRSAWGRVPKRGRVNLLTWTEDFSNAVWVKSNATASGKVITDASNSFGLAQQINIPVINGSTYTLSTSIKKTTSATTYPLLQLGRSMLDLPADYAAIIVNTNNGTVNAVVGGGYTAPTSSSIVSDPNDATCWLVSLTDTMVATSTRVQLYPAASSNGTTLSATAQGSAEFRFAQLEAGSATNYQRVTTAFDITEPGQTNCYYLQPDGVNDGYVTSNNLDLSGTDKVTVFAAVRQLSNSTTSVLVEQQGFATNSFGMFAPRTTGAGCGFVSRGSTARDATATGFAAPVTLVITGIGDISGDVSRIRVNGVQQAENLLDQGTGNYGNQALYLFRRIGGTLPANLQCFASIVAGGSYSLATIQRVEQILSKYTPGVTL
jgi:hypothetical protein